MNFAYIDTSWLIKISFEDKSGKLRKRLADYETIFSSDLLIAELLAYARRENLAEQILTSQLRAISLILPDRSLRPEMEKVVRVGYVRGADLWHLACACYLAPRPHELSFLTADEHQQEVARALGFKTRK